MTFYKIRSKKQLQELSTKHKALRDKIRAENEAELLSTEERLFDVGKIFKPLVEQTITAPLKQIVSEKVPPTLLQPVPAIEGISTRPALPSSSVTLPQRPFSGTTPLLQLTPQLESILTKT
jgi:hypothetical protein